MPARPVPRPAEPGEVVRIPLPRPPGRSAESAAQPHRNSSALLPSPRSQASSTLGEIRRTEHPPRSEPERRERANRERPERRLWRVHEFSNRRHRRAHNEPSACASHLVAMITESDRGQLPFRLTERAKRRVCAFDGLMPNSDSCLAQMIIYGHVSCPQRAVLLLPWPMRVRASDFRPVEGSRLAKEPFGFFESSWTGCWWLPARK